jgi:tetratricopeptide (TPR) repeat protein
VPARHWLGVISLVLMLGCAGGPRIVRPAPVAVDAPDVTAAFERADLLQARGDLAAAVEALREIVKSSLNPVHHVRYQDAALALPLRQGQAAPQTFAMRRFYAQRGDDGRSPLQPFLQARLERLDRREGPARVLLEKALKRSPGFYEAQYELGLLWRGVGNLGKAAQWFRSAIKLAPKRAPAHLVLAEVASEAGGWPEAALGYQRYLALEKADKAAKRAYLSILLYRVDGDPAEMERLMSELWKTASQDLNLQMDRAAVYCKRGKIQLAIDNYRAVIQRDPKRSRAVLNFGNLFYDKGLKLPKGAEERATALEKARQAYRYFRGLGESEDAFDWFDLELAVRVRLKVIETELGQGSQEPVRWQDL